MVEDSGIRTANKRCYFPSSGVVVAMVVDNEGQFAAVAADTRPRFFEEE